MFSHHGTPLINYRGGYLFYEIICHFLRAQYYIILVSHGFVNMFEANYAFNGYMFC